ncbi:MAG: methyltransferase domain-containing protein [Planctomycetales bacterium]|nr:methyltransferase domain-containing protein [Planctomycetales bacterium]
MRGRLKFLWQFLTAYRTTGALTPSSRRLAEALVRPLSARDGQPIRVLEAGPGTGAVTEAIVPHLRAGDRLTLYEVNPAFAEHLRRRFESDPRLAPARDRVRIVEDTVERCDERDYDHAVCGIPFTNFPADLVRRILGAMWERLRPGGTLSYFEYWGLRRVAGIAARRETRERVREVARVTDDFHRRFGAQREIVVWNMPPAVAHTLRKP